MISKLVWGPSFELFFLLKIHFERFKSYLHQKKFRGEIISKKTIVEVRGGWSEEYGQRPYFRAFKFWDPSLRAKILHTQRKIRWRHKQYGDTRKRQIQRCRKCNIDNICYKILEIQPPTGGFLLAPSESRRALWLKGDFAARTDERTDRQTDRRTTGLMELDVICGFIS